MRTMWWMMFVKKSIENGIDVIRIFDALNDTAQPEDRRSTPRKKYGGILRGRAISYTMSPVHTEEYFVKLAMELEKMGAETHLHQGHGQPAAAVRGL